MAAAPYTEYIRARKAARELNRLQHERLQRLQGLLVSMREAMKSSDGPLYEHYANEFDDELSAFELAVGNVYRYINAAEAYRRAIDATRNKPEP